MINVIYMKEYRRLFFSYAVASALIFGLLVIITFNFQLTVSPLSATGNGKLLFYLYLITATAYGWYLKSRREKLMALPALEERIAAHKSFYAFKVVGSGVMAVLLAILFLVTRRYLFLYLGLFQIMWMATNYPFRFVFRKELKEEELLFA